MNMTTLGTVQNKVIEMARNYHDEFVPVADISFDNLKSVNIGNSKYPLKTVAQWEISNRLGVPYSYLRKCPEDVQAYNLNHWIKKERNEELFLRFDDQEVRAVFTPRYVPVDNVAVMEKLQKLGFGPETQVQCRMDGNFMMLNIPDHRKEFVVTEKDKMRPGISIGNSETGIASLSIAAFILRLVCTNGLISKTDTTSSYRHVSSGILDKFPQIMGQLSREIGQRQQQLQFSLESRVDNPETTMMAFNRQFALGEQEKQAVEWGWIFEAGGSMYNIVNAYTKASQYEGLPAESAHKLQRVGGQILGMVKAN